MVLQNSRGIVAILRRKVAAQKGGLGRLQPRACAERPINWIADTKSLEQVAGLRFRPCLKVQLTGWISHNTGHKT
jgi:hypothetical protein